jgi:hypothetical protein
LRYEFKPSFDRSIKALPSTDKREIIEICLAFIDSIENRAKLPAGLGLKHLRADYWEIRKGLRCRILFRRQKDFIKFILAGDHDSIKIFLKNL